MNHAVAIAPPQEKSDINRIVDLTSTLGRDIVELDGFLDAMKTRARDASGLLESLDQTASTIVQANDAVQGGLETLVSEATRTQALVEQAIGDMRNNATGTEVVANWVRDLETRMEQLTAVLSNVHSNTEQINQISKQINILAINARIEAVRAGDAGRGFAVVAEAINALALQTSDTAGDIVENVERVGGWVTAIGKETVSKSALSAEILSRQEGLNDMLDSLGSSAATTHECVHDLSREGEVCSRAIEEFTPTYARMSAANRATSEDIAEAGKRSNALINAGEEILVRAVMAGGEGVDAKMIADVQRDASRMGRLLETAVGRGEITMEALFSETYTPIPGTDPQQVLTPATAITDRYFPEIQETALARNERIVFCAAVDRNGYLPTHNRIFSQPQGADPVQNEAHSRNRRIFNDRVGLKAGRNTDPFLVQIYRRNMGGGSFVMMKDTSAPIIVNGRHWGGLRLAYKFRAQERI